MKILIFSFMLVCTATILISFFLTLRLRRRIKDLISETPVANLILTGLKSGAEISVAELTMIEATLQELSMVVVVANRVEAPEKAMREAVIENMARGVKYLFLVSQSTAASELEGYFRDFETAALVARNKHGLKSAPKEMADIMCLSFEWEDVPYVFYRMRNGMPSQESGAAQTIAFHGVAPGNGLADRYKLVSFQLAHSLIKALMGQAPEPIKIAVGEVSIAEFTQGKIVSFPAK